MKARFSSHPERKPTPRKVTLEVPASFARFAESQDITVKELLDQAVNMLCQSSLVSKFNPWLEG